MNRLRLSRDAFKNMMRAAAPDEVRNLPAHGQLLFLAGQRPVFAEKLAYFADPEFREMFDPV